MHPSKSSRKRIRAIRNRRNQAREKGVQAQTSGRASRANADIATDRKSGLVEERPLWRDDNALAAYNPRLLHQSRTQLQLGDWEKLADLDEYELEHNPAALELQLLAAAGHLQKGGEQARDRARALLDRAIEAGLDRESVARILIGGAFNSLGRCAALSNQSIARVRKHFTSAVTVIAPDVDAEALVFPHATRQILMLGKVARCETLIQLSHQLGLELTVGNTGTEIEEQKLLSPGVDPCPVEDKAPKEAATNRGKKPTAKAQQTKDSNIARFISDASPYFLGESITYVDIGAFTGSVFLEIRALNKVRIREAHLVEPNPKSFEELKKNTREVRLPSLHHYQVAILESEGKKRFIAAGSMTKMTEVGQGILDGDEQSFECHSVRLDSIAENFTDGRVGLLKIDTEGTELEVLRSGRHLLSNQLIDLIYLEVGFNPAGKQQVYFTDIDNLLSSYGYRVFGVYEQTREWIEDLPILRRSNMAYMSAKFAASHKTSLVLENERLRELLQSKEK